MGILSKTIDTVKDVGKGVLTTLLDPQGNTRGSIAAQKLVDEGQGYINKLEAQIGASTKFWADHQKMLGNNYTSYEWKEALLAREIEQEKAKLKDTGKILPPNYIQQLKDSGAANELYELYEEKMNKAKDYKLTSGIEYTDANIKTHIKNHSRTSRNVINRAARQLFNSYGWDKDLFAAFGFGRDRTAVKQEIGDYSFLLQAEDGPIKQRFIEQLTQELHLGKGRFNNIDVKELTAMFENMTIDYKPIVKDAMTSSEMLKNPRAEDMVNYMINIESGNLDASLFPKLDESENYVFEGVGGFGLTGFLNVTMTPQEMIDQLWVQRNNNEKKEGGNSFINFVSDFKQMASLLTNVATDKEFGINATDTQIELNMTAYNLIKNKIKAKDKDYFSSGSTYDAFYLDYEKLTVEEKLAFISTIGDTLIEAGGNKTAIKENLPLIEEKMKEALNVTDKAIIKAIEFSITEQTFNSKEEVNKYKNKIASLYNLNSDNTSYINSLIDDKFEEQANSPLEKQMQNTFDPLSASLNPTSNLNQDMYTQTVSESIKDEMLKETLAQEEDTPKGRERLRQVRDIFFAGSSELNAFENIPGYALLDKNNSVNPLLSQIERATALGIITPDMDNSVVELKLTKLLNFTAFAESRNSNEKISNEGALGYYQFLPNKEGQQNSLNTAYNRLSRELGRINVKVPQDLIRMKEEGFVSLDNVSKESQSLLALSNYIEDTPFDIRTGERLSEKGSKNLRDYINAVPGSKEERKALEFLYYNVHHKPKIKGVGLSEKELKPIIKNFETSYNKIF